MPAEKYTAIYNDLKQKIEEGLYAPQSVLPSENILTTRYGVSRNTVRRAIAKLADESYVQSIHGLTWSISSLSLMCSKMTSSETEEDSIRTVQGSISISRSL